MAILQNLESIYGASFKEAYHRIISAEFNYQTMVTFKVAIYVDANARDKDNPPIYVRKVTMPIDEKVFAVRKPTYDYLKTTNNYAESKNV
jgi:hypothetical protein